MAAPASKAPLSFTIAMTALLLGAAAMGISPVFVRFADVGPFASAFWRVLLALPVLWLWAAIEAKRAGLSHKTIWKASGAIWLAGAIFAGDLFFWHLSILNTTVANATFLATMAPVWVVLGSGWLIGEKVGRNTVIGLIICIAGAGILIGSSYSFAPERLIGDIYGVATSLFFGAYFLVVRVARRKDGAGHVIFASTIITMLILFVIAMSFEATIIPHGAQGIMALIALGIVSHAGGQGMLSVALGTLPAAFSSLVIFIEAMLAALFGWLILSESLSLMQFVGGATILAGIWVARPKA